MTAPTIHAVTGAFGYSGGYIARRLLQEGKEVITLTNSPRRPHELQGRIRAVPFHFDRPELLAAQLEGVQVLYNTYWVRFNHRTFTHAEAVRNTRILFEAAKAAGVARIVHVSITNPSLNSPLEYFRGKAELEHALQASGLSYAILRPTVLFGEEDILINNLCWLLRTFPVFGVFGKGDYRLQPIYVDDLAALAVRMGAVEENHTVEAIGPETFTFVDLLKLLADALGRKVHIFRLNPRVGALLSRAAGFMLGDVLVTPEEIEGLMQNLLYVPEVPPTGNTRLSEWVLPHASTLGHRYSSELARRLDRSMRYA